MDHLEFVEQTVPLRAASEIFLATVARVFVQVILIFDGR
jgi:hypothetical protein